MEVADMDQAVFTFYSIEPRPFDELVRRTFGVCKSVAGFDVRLSGEASEIDDFSPDEGGVLGLSWQEGSGDVSVAFICESLPDSLLEISTRRSVFFPKDDEGEYEGLARAVVELVRKLAIGHDPHYVMSPELEIKMGVDPTDAMPTTTDFELERIPWFGVYSQSLIEKLGGREHVLETPAWRVEELDSCR